MRGEAKGPMKRLVIPWLLLALGLVVPGGCAVNPATGEQMFSVMSPGEEARIGREQHPKLIKAFGGRYDDRALGDYVTAIGRRLVAVSELPGPGFTFTVLNSGKVNAFALPGGYVYITRGIIALANSEAELAGVIAHEIGHVTARHAAQRYSQRVAAGLGLTLLGVLTGSGDLVRAAGTGAELYLRSYSRRHELEADTLGIRYLRRAGYDPGAMAGFLANLEAHSILEARLAGNDTARAEGTNLLSTHPRTIERVRKAAQASANIAVKNPVVGREAYLGRIDGMLFGADPAEGYIRGRLFAHPGLGFRFTVPPGFRLVNTRARVIAHGPGKSVIIFDRAGKPVRGSLVGYLRRVWARGVALQDVEPLTVNGMGAATGRVRLDTRRGPIDARLLAIRYDADKIYRFVFITPAGLTRELSLELRRTTYSFRRLGIGEARRLRPRRLRIHRVEPGDTADGLARRMPFAERRRQRFEVLNGLSPGANLTPGRLVKIIAEG
ncbi:MAG: M48 family metalloprotease [Proteobacteria bacterium]|nr:M48 family metalloprotease [Pseudomonadota bacterium]